MDFRPKRKTDSEEFMAMEEAGRMTKALRALHPKHTRDSCLVLCGNESFLKTAENKAGLKQAKIRHWVVPAKSPHLDPLF